MIQKLIKLSEPVLGKKEITAVSKVIKSGWLTAGPITKKFEEIVKKKINSQNIIAVNSCTSGINAVLHALDLKPGDEVITTPMTFISTISNLYNYGLKIKFVDISKNDYTINFEQLKKKITNKTKCILITHYGGYPTDIRKIIPITKKKKIYLIEDAATAFGSKIINKYVGSFKETITIFSFYANKIITSGGEGGIISLQNKNLSEKIRKYVSLGIDKTPWARNIGKNHHTYDVIYPGFKYNISDLHSAVGIEQVRRLDQLINGRKKIKKIYFTNLEILKKKNIISFLEEKENFYSSEYIFTILLNKNMLKVSRDDLIEYLKQNKINTAIHYLPFNYTSFYKSKYKNSKFPNSDYVYENILSLPFHNKLKKNDIYFVCNKIKRFLLKNLNEK